jgi:peptidoglycan/xylan/chitin deacetylase (PgdA/CDA1 family)
MEDSWTEGLLILMYHSVDVPPVFHRQRGLYVTPQHLTRQLRELQTTSQIDFSTLAEWNRARPSGRYVAVTFDDAYRSLFVKGLPVLQETGVHALTYVVASLIGKSNQWDDANGARREPLMDRVQLTEWIAAGHEIGSHGLTHRQLTSLPLDEARREIADSKHRLEDLFGQPIRHFCYPYGDWNEAIRDMVQEAGYETATSTISGLNIATTDAFVLRRFLAWHQRPYLAALIRR